MVLLCLSNEILKLIDLNIQKNNLFTRELKKDLNILRNFHNKIIRKMPFLNSGTLKNVLKNVYMLLQMIRILSSRNFPNGCFLM